MSGYPPSPHTSVPPTPPGTAFTGAPDLSIATIVMVLLLIAALLFAILGRAFSKDER